MGTPKRVSACAVAALVLALGPRLVWAQGEDKMPVIEAAKLALPAKVQAGERLTLTGAFRVMRETPGERGLRLELSKDGLVVAAAEINFAQPISEWKPDELSEATVEFTIPPWLRAGAYRFDLRAATARVLDRAEQPMVRSVEIATSAPSPTTAEVKDLFGAPALYVNGKPLSGMGYATDHPQPEAIRGMAAAGIGLLSFPLTADYDLYGLADDVWTGPDKYDYAALDRRVVAVLEAAPDAYLLPRVFLCSPPWWDRKYPRELALFGDGKHELPLAAPGRKDRYPSFGSTRWRQAAADNLRRLLEHIGNAPYADRVIGYQLATGENGNWQYWGATKSAFPDYAPCCDQQFRRWLRERYGDLTEVRAAWGGLKLDWGAPRLPLEKIPAVPADAKITWGDIEVPPMNLRIKGTPFSVHDPASSQAIVDCQLFLSHLVADTLLQWAAVAKEATQRQKIIGAAYGHVLEQAWHPYGLQHGGHLALDQVLASADVDFLAGSPARTDLTVGTGYDPFPAPVDSITRHGKLWLDLCDIPTHLVSGPDGKHGKPGDAAGTALMLRREAGQALSHGAALLWTDRTGNSYQDEETQTVIGELAGAADRQLRGPRQSVAQIAVVVDPESAAYLGPGNALSYPLLNEQCVELGHLGAPVDLVTLDDLVAGQLPPYRLYIFLNAFRSDASLRQAVRDQVERDHQTALWIYGPGALDRAGASARAAMELTGISLTMREVMQPLRVVVSTGHPYCDDLPNTFEYGTTKPVGPIFHAVDPEAEGIGKVKGLGAVGLCMKDFDTWTSIFSAAPNLPATMLRNIAREAGVHLYMDGGDVVYASRGVLAIQAAKAGRKEVKLLGPSVVRDLVSGLVQAENVNHVEVDLAAGQTVLWGVEPVTNFGRRPAGN